MYKVLNELCEFHKVPITSLCKLITGSSGNLATWKKDYMRSDYLAAVADYFSCSTDYILERTNNPTVAPNIDTTDIAVPTGDIAFAVHLRFLRESKNKTQKEVAEAIDISEAAYQAIEFGKAKPTYDTLIALADYYDCSLDDLVGRVRNKEDIYSVYKKFLQNNKSKNLETKYLNTLLLYYQEISNIMTTLKLDDLQMMKGYASALSDKKNK